MLNLQKNIVTKILIIVMVGFTLVFNVDALSITKSTYAVNSQGDITVTECLDNGGQKFLQFVEFFVYSGSLMDAYIQPFLDISRSQCQVADIVFLKHQKQKSIETARRLFLRCEDEKAEKLKIAIVQTNAEIYYVRHIVDTTFFKSLPSVAMSQKQLKSLEYDADKLDSEIRKNYFNNSLLSDNELNLYMQRLRTKYETRKEKYLNCQHDGFEAVKEKLSEFVDNWGGTKKAGTSLIHTVGSAADEMINSAGEMTWESTAKGLAVANLNDLMFKDGKEEIYQDFSKLDLAPNTTFDQLMSEINNISQTIDIDQKQIDLQSEFQIRYGKASDASVKIITDKLEEIDKTIKDTVKEVNGVRSCVEKMNSKQCSN